MPARAACGGGEGVSGPVCTPSCGGTGQGMRHSDQGTFRYPEEVRPLFLETPDLVFKDGRRVSPAEIWDYMTEEAPKRYPYAYSTNPSFGGRFSCDVWLLSGIKRSYMGMTAIDRLKDAHSKGTPLVVIQGGYTFEPYYAAGCIPVGPMFPRGWIMNLKEGRDFDESNRMGMALLEESRKMLSIESCNLIACLTIMKKMKVPVNMVAPCLCTRCSDMAYVTEACRHDTISQAPLHIVDYPVNHHWGEWRVDYLKEELQTLTEKLGKLSGKEVTDRCLRDEIRQQNYARSLVRECQKTWWQAKVPPTNSSDSGMAHLGVGGMFDFTAATQILEETLDEIRTRSKQDVKGAGLVDDPARLYICGSCAHTNPGFVDSKGGVIVGRDDMWSTATMEVQEAGDPYENLARAMASLPYERPTVERAEWTVEQIQESRADGVIFIHNWGCNYQSAIARMVTDIIKERTGLPAISIEVGELARMESTEQFQNRAEAFIEMLA